MVLRPTLTSLPKIRLRQVNISLSPEQQLLQFANRENSSNQVSALTDPMTAQELQCLAAVTGVAVDNREQLPQPQGS